MKMSEVIMGIALIVLAVIVAHPIAGYLRRNGVPINP